MTRICSLLLCALLLTSGCKRATPYSALSPRPQKDTKVDTAPPSLSDDFAWMDTGDVLIHPSDTPIEFIHEGSNPDEWHKLSAYWNDPTLSRAVGLLGGPALSRGAAVLADKNQPIKIKVPLGLDDPMAYIPANNPPTREKFELGRALFFDQGWLTAKGNLSCATCHRPDHGFSNSEAASANGFNVPTLINSVYNPHQFWDGRAGYLEESVQRTLTDEREPASGEFTHVWHGVIARLRQSQSWKDRFVKVFGIAPTQDTLGKVLATYMRTLLAGNSLHDRAVAVQQKKESPKLLPEHYEQSLDDDTMKKLGRTKEAKTLVAASLARGHDLFRGKAACAGCHTPGNGHFSDGRFYNIGVETGTRVGRFAWAPYGEKNRYLRGAYKVPTLRSLSRTGPYFHDGSGKDLVQVVRAHVKPPADDKMRLYLDPRFKNEKGDRKDFGLSEQDIADLVLFVQALDGDDYASVGKY